MSTTQLDKLYPLLPSGSRMLLTTPSEQVTDIRSVFFFTYENSPQLRTPGSLEMVRLQLASLFFRFDKLSEF